MMQTNSIIIKIIKNISKVLALLVMVWLQVIGGIVLYMKGVPLVVVGMEAILCVIFVAALFWPAITKVIGVRANQRQWTLRWLGIPALVLGVVLYMAVVFYIEDVPVLLGTMTVMLLAVLLRQFYVPNKNAQRHHALRRLSVATLAMVILTIVSVPLVERYRTNHAEEGAALRQEAIADQSNQDNKSEKVRVYPIQTGTTTVSYGQFYGGLDGWEGIDGYLKTLVSKDTITVPITAYLIDHPKHGLMMVDAGINWEQAHDHDGYYNHNYMLSRLLTTRDEYQLAAPQDIEVQVARLGYTLDDIKTVFMTHVHDDHAGGLRNLPNAKVVLDKKDWNDDARYPYSFAFAEKNMVYPTFDSGAFSGFSESMDYFGDGSVVLVPTPGHSPGHMSVSVQMDENRVFMTGDTLYTLRHLAVDEVRQIMLGGEDTQRQVEVAHTIQRMFEQDPSTVMLFAHDHTDYHYKHTLPYLADGVLDSQERQSLLAYRTSLFANDWQLQPGNLPYYYQQEDGRSNGVVRFR